MSRERELLERARDIFEDICDARSVGIELAICGYLSTPEPEQDEGPVAWIVDGRLKWKCRCVDFDDCQPLYLHPAPREFVRLSGEEIRKIRSEWKIDSAFARAIEDALEEKNK